MDRVDMDLIYRRKEKALKHHDRMSRLFREDRPAFELERKKEIDAFIDSFESGFVRDQLRDLQKKWDVILKFPSC